MRATKSNRSSSRRFHHRTLESLEQRQLLTAAPTISEFMAVNDSTLADQDGEFSDWLELVNAGDEAVNLNGYWLTDDPGNLSKWRLPEVTLDSAEYLTVFASGKDREDPNGELHTNFRIGGGGEYLALVEPDGQTIAHEFSPDFPTQVPNVSYGIGTDVATTTLLAAGANASYLAPTDDSTKETWYRTDFDDATWKSGQTGIGYDTGAREIDPHVESILGLEPLGYWRFEEAAGLVASNSGTTGADWNATIEGGPALDVAGPTSAEPTFGLGDGNSGITFDRVDDAVITGQSLLDDVTEFTMMGFVKPDNLEGTNMGLFGQNNVAEFGFNSSTSLRLSTTAGGRITFDYTFPTDEWHHVAAVGTGLELQIYVDGQLLGSGGRPTVDGYGSSNFGFNIGGGGIFGSSGDFYGGHLDEVVLLDRALSGEEITTLISHEAGNEPQFAADIATDVQADLLNTGSSLFTRIPFTVQNPTAFNQLLLQAKYDDGFVAYLNGAEILRVNAPGESDVALDFNATAFEVRLDSAASEFETFDLSSERDLLIMGENLLAIQMLNLSADNPDLLMVPVLEASVVTIDSTSAGYLTTPTPGSLNNPVSEDLGPLVDDVDHLPSQPNANEPIVVSAKIVRTLQDIAQVNLSYRVMFDDEVLLAMADNGTAGDAVAGDGIYTATIPGGIASAGQMVRWRIEASDTDSATGRGPKFEFRTGNNQDAEYFGTMIANDAVTSEIPILHWFVEQERPAGTAAGTRASLYFNGEFHDNVFVRQRGGSTRDNVLGKTNFKFDFKGNQFEFDPAYPRVEEFNINTTATDKAYVRQSMAFETYRVMGAPSSISFPMHVQRNGEFYGVFAFIEEPSEEMLEREGLDPNGALYKMRNEFTAAAGNDKKTRQFEDNSDLDSFVKSIRDLSGPELTTYLFDNVDIPAVLNYLVATVLTHQNDNPHKNHSLYRDSEGTGEWLFLPWDNDLTWGSNWAGSSFLDIIYADMDEIREGPVPGHDLSVIHPSHPFINSQQHREWNNHWNRLMDAVINDPTTQEMFLRRLRTGMDLFLGAPGTENSYFDQRFDEYLATIAPDVEMDLARWANPWKWGEDQSFEQAIDVIKTEYLEVRRTHLYETHSIDRLSEADFTVLVPQNGTGKYFVPGDDSLGTTWTTAEFNDTAWQEGQAGFGFDLRDRITDEIKTTVNPRDTVEEGTSLFIRMPFTIDDPAQVTRLLLQMQYDDAAIIYLNGTEIERLNHADDGETLFNTRPRARAGDVTGFANVPIHEHVGLLKAGDNVLAIHGLNRTATTSDDMLISPILIEGFFSTVEIAGIPHGQETTPVIRFDAANFDANPASGNQDEEFVKFDNPNDFAVDISGWRIAGGIEHVFKPGTVLTANGSIYVSPNVPTFRARQTGPSGGQGLFVQGNYQGHLSNLGESLQLIAEDGTIVDSLTIAANPSDLQQNLRITELHYNPPGFDDATQFIELQNIGSSALDLTGVTLSQGPSLPFTLPAGTSLDAGGYLVIASDPAALQAAHPNLSANRVVGPFEGNFSNQGERIKLDDATGSTIVEFVYNDSDIWPESADGAGASLVVIDPANLDVIGKHYGWRGSAEFEGSPGGPSADRSAIVINEVVNNNTGANPAVDSIELFNPGDATVDVSGWYLSDSSDDLLKFAIPAGSMIAPGGYLVIDESQFNPNPANPGEKDFALNGTNGDDLWLTVSDGQGGVSQFVDDAHFGATRAGESFSLDPAGTGLYVRTTATIGSENSTPIAPTAIISEIYYRPTPPSAAAILEFDGMSAGDLEFLEIANPGQDAVDLTNWRIRGGISYNFDDGVMLNANQTVVVLPFDPVNARNSHKLDAFLAEFPNAESAVLVGGYQGQLSDSEDRVELQSPDTPINDVTPRVFEDQVLYDNRAPWPTLGANLSWSLQRSAPANGSLTSLWSVTQPSPGAFSVFDPTNGDFDGDGVLGEGDITLLCRGIRSGDVSFDLNSDGLINSADRDTLILTNLGSTYGDANLNGVFDSSDLVIVFQAAEYEDGIAGNSTWSEGDWNCDGEFSSRDIVRAFQQGDYREVAIASVRADDVVADRNLAPNEIAAALQLAETNRLPDQRQENAKVRFVRQSSAADLAAAKVDAVFDSTDRARDEAQPTPDTEFELNE